jgi:Protein of unknown function (DUF1493)
MAEQVAAMNNDKDQVRNKLIDLIRKYVGRRTVIGDDTLILHDLGIGGDDAVDFLNDVAGEFETTYFPDETEALWLHWATLLGYRSKKRELSVRHLLDVIAMTHWFEEACTS